MSDHNQEIENSEILGDESRRKFFGTTAVATLAGAGLFLPRRLQVQVLPGAPFYDRVV